MKPTRTTPRRLMTPCRSMFAGAATLAALVLPFSEAGAVSPAVKKACANDYFAHCSMHPVDTPQLRKCMRAVGRNLSPVCINALVAAGEVSNKDLKRYKSASAR